MVQVWISTVCLFLGRTQFWETYDTPLKFNKPDTQNDGLTPFECGHFLVPLQETNISHLGKRKSIDSSMPYQGDMFVSWRVSILNILGGPIFSPEPAPIHIKLNITRWAPKTSFKCSSRWWFHIFFHVHPETWGRFPF